MEVPERNSAGRAPGLSLTRLLASNPRQEAILDFLSKTLSRSRTHRLLWLAYLAGAAAVLLNSSLINGAIFLKGKGDAMRALRFVVLFWPQACSIILVSGMRHVFLIPCELPANWIFRSTESLGRADWMTAVERFVLARAVLPWCLLAYPATAYAYGAAAAARVTVLQALVSLAAFELVFDGWQKLPFTCAHIPGKRSPVGIFGAYLAVLGMLVPMLTVFIAASGAFWFVFPVWLFAFGGVWLWLRRARRELWSEGALAYDAVPDVASGIGISGIRHGAIPPPFASSR